MDVAIVEKDPDVAQTFTLNYVDQLAAMGTGLTISSSTWTIPAGIVKDSDAATATTTTIRFSSGTDGKDYAAVNNLTLSDGQTLQKLLIVQVRQEELGTSQDATDRVNALNMLIDWLQPDVVPPLELSDLKRALNRHKAATTWTVSTAYVTGQRILPPVRNGWWYQVVQPGTSQSGNRAFSEWPTIYGQRLVDGSSDPQLILEVAGEDDIFCAEHSNPLSVNCYDVRGAARECIQQRLQQSVHYVDGRDLRFDQVTKHLEGLLKRFYPIRFPVKVMRA